MALILHDYKGFAIQSFDRSPEASLISLYCFTKDILLVKTGRNLLCPTSYVPSGSVEWCLASLSKHLKPEYYPDWCKHLLYRKVWQSDKWLCERMFVKPADHYKRFDGFKTHRYATPEQPPFWYSDIVEFKDEYRYYITNGAVVAADWYWNEYNRDGEIIEAPKLDLDIPKDWCGTIDMGYLSTGEFALIECHHPFACGWYGGSANIEIYMQWLIDGWMYLNKLKR